MAAALTAALQSRDAFPLTLEEARRLAGRRCAVMSGAWELLGHRELMSTEARKLLYCYDGDGRVADGLNVCLAAVKLALAALRGGGGRCVVVVYMFNEWTCLGSNKHIRTTQYMTKHDREEELLSHAHSPMKANPAGAKRRRHTPNTNSTSNSNEGGFSLYETALAELCTLQYRFPVPVEALLPATMALLLHEQAALRGELRGAHELGLLLRGVARPPALTAAAARQHEVGAGGGAGLEAFVEGQLQWCLALAETGRASEGVREAERLAAFCERKSAW